MSIGEWISKGINKQVGQQPESIKNAASRWVDKTFGKADASIIAFVQEGVEPESPQAKVDLADTIAHTPNYLLERVVDPRRTQNESQEEARGRVTEQVVRLFGALDSATKAHTEDVRSEVAHNLAQKPQQIFDRLLKKSLNYGNNNMAPRMRLSAALVGSGVVENHKLTVNGAEESSSFGLNNRVRDNAETRFAQIVVGEMGQSADKVPERNEAEIGIQKFVSLQEAASDVMGVEFKLKGDKVAVVVLDKVTSSIVAEMGQPTSQVHPRNEAEVGIAKYATIATKLKEVLGREMPEAAAEVVIDKIEPSIVAEMGQPTSIVPVEQEPIVGQAKALKIQKRAIPVFEGNPKFIERVNTIVSKYQNLSLAS